MYGILLSTGGPNSLRPSDRRFNPPNSTVPPSGTATEVMAGVGFNTGALGETGENTRVLHPAPLHRGRQDWWQGRNQRQDRRSQVKQTRRQVQADKAPVAGNCCPNEHGYAAGREQSVHRDKRDLRADDDNVQVRSEELLVGHSDRGGLTV